jgi:excinuclease ABC subunit C
MALAEGGGLVCVQVFFYRAGQNFGNRTYFPARAAGVPPDEVLAAFIGQFYADKEPPALVLVSEDIPETDLLEEALAMRAGRKVSLSRPLRGTKRGLVEQALANARESLARRLSESAAQRKLLEGVADAFGLDAPPARVEIYDNSHISGANPVGAMVVAGPDGFVKKSYRKFNIRDKDLAPGDDYGMMREVMTRRFRRALREDADRQSGDWPDLVLVDGGEGQLGAVTAVLADLGVDDLAVVGISKGPDRDAGREHFHMPGRRSFMMKPNDPVLYYLQRLRDEAHRFAIGSHRTRRSAGIARSALDDIPGVGGTRKRALLHHFGSGRAVAEAGLADLEKVTGISRPLAKKIYDHFHADG